jgi:3-oxoacyl-[acyl-carrier protein] reductase
MGDILNGKVAVVTGSGQGIGRAIAIGMAEEGAKVVTNNRRPGSTGKGVLSDSQIDLIKDEEREQLEKDLERVAGDAETTAETIREAGGEAISFFGDISDFKVAADLIQTTVDKFGKIDILVNVAGSFGFSPVWEISEELWDKVNNVKPKGHFNTIRHALPHMMEQKWGRIINCTSRAFLGDVIKHAEYCTANAGVVGLTRAVAIEMYPYGITCNAFSPYALTRASYELTAYGSSTSREDGPFLMKRTPSGPMPPAPDPADIVPFLIYLTTDAAKMVSGSIFSLGGNGVGLYSEPVIARNLVKTGERWTQEELIQQAPRALFMGYRSIAEIE